MHYGTKQVTSKYLSHKFIYFAQGLQKENISELGVCFLLLSTNYTYAAEEVVYLVGRWVEGIRLIVRV